MKTEHAGAKNGGGHWGRRAEAKQLSKKARREDDRSASSEGVPPMTTTRERKENKAERLRKWAEGRDGRAEELTARDAHYRGDHAFNTQPGRIPERDRVNARSRSAAEHAAKASSMRSRADGIDRAAKRAIYSDDEDMVERLEEKIAKLEAKREEMKTANAAYRKEHRAELKALTKYGRDQVIPFPSWAISNLGGVITSTRKRLAIANAPRVPRSITARRDGTCDDCGNAINKGTTTITEIEPHVWIHASCAVARDAGAPE